MCVCNCVCECVIVCVRCFLCVDNTWPLLAAGFRHFWHGEMHARTTILAHTRKGAHMRMRAYTYAMIYYAWLAWLPLWCFISSSRCCNRSPGLPFNVAVDPDGRLPPALLLPVAIVARRLLFTVWVLSFLVYKLALYFNYDCSRHRGACNMHHWPIGQWPLLPHIPNWLHFRAHIGSFGMRTSFAVDMLLPMLLLTCDLCDHGKLQQSCCFKF